MTTREPINSWADVTLEHLFYAYRKAKADCYFERFICVAENFANYEKHLSTNLQRLLKELHAGEPRKLLTKHLVGTRVVAKRLGVNALNGDRPRAHSHFSDPTRAFSSLCDSSTLTPEFRLVGDFRAEMHVLSALWINLVGHKYDAVLGKSAYGSRLRRYRPKAKTQSIGDYHLEAPASFQPYFEPYKAWRNNGLATIRRELDAGNAVVAVSMDFTSYFHQIDPDFFVKQEFLQHAGIELSEWELDFSRTFANSLTGWSKELAKHIRGQSGSQKDVVGGLPIGLSISRIVANALLVGLDRDIEASLAPLYYGRYVDDLLIVLRDPGNLNNAADVLSYIGARTVCFPTSKEEKAQVFLKLPGKFQGKTKLELQPSKQKVFFLEGQAGLDLLSSIESQIRSVSSERRLMPSPDHLESMTSAQVLTAAGHANDEADSLRRADGLSIRRLGWSVQLRAVETLARDLRDDDWKKERAKFYEFAHNHILRPDKILDHLDYLPRLLSLAVALRDWGDAKELLTATLEAVAKLESRTTQVKMRVNGREIPARSNFWRDLQKTILEVARETILRSLRWTSRTGQMCPLNQTAQEFCREVGLVDEENIRIKALELRESDWAKTAYKDHVLFHAESARLASDNEFEIHDLYQRESKLREFLKRSYKRRLNLRCQAADHATDESLLPYLFPTRPYTAQEIAHLLQPECVAGADSAVVWGQYVNAVRGTWVNAAPSKVQVDEKKVWVIGKNKAADSVRLGITSLSTSDFSFGAAANGRPDRSRARYERIETVINQALTAKPRPTHLLLPELSLPQRWVKTVSERLLEARISLIAGLDYQRQGSSIHSEAVMVLTDNRLGYPSSIEIRQTKFHPASGEEENLLRLFGVSWTQNLDAFKPVYMHDGFTFGVLICSELQNIANRQRYRGNVDCVMVLSWNRDLETFSALVESASLDVHGYVALVNNRRYGDSRVRSPGKKDFQRDICRLRGGSNDHLVVVDLDIKLLRGFQCRAKNWPREDDPFKPVPEGYVPAGYRKTTPK